MDQLKVGQRVAKITRAGGIEFGRVKDLVAGGIAEEAVYAVSWDHEPHRWASIPHAVIEQEQWYVGIEAEELEVGT